MTSRAPSLGTRRFVTFALSLVALTFLSALGLSLDRDGGVIASVLTPVAAFCAAALGFGSAHDTKVRVAQTEQPVDKLS